MGRFWKDTGDIWKVYEHPAVLDDFLANHVFLFLQVQLTMVFLHSMLFDPPSGSWENMDTARPQAKMLPS